MKQKTEQDKTYRIEWKATNGRTYTEFFTTPEVANSVWGIGVPYVHTWRDPAEGLRKYLQHLPLIDVKITELT